MDPNGNWGERETYFEGLNKQNAMLNRDRALTGGFDATTKICCRIGRAARFPRIAPIAYKMTTTIYKGISYKMNGPNPAKFSNCILRLLYDGDFMRKSSILFLLQQGAGRLPTKWPPKWAFEPLQISTYKMAGLLKVISYKMTLEIGLIWAWRPSIS